MRMKKMNKLWLLLPLFSLFGCSYNQNEISTYDVLPYQEDMIVLQNLQTRVLAYCYTSPSYTAEYCAKEFEGKGKLIVGDTIALAKKLDMKIVAEGIETREQVDFLAEKNCDLIQGYYFAKPMPVKEFEHKMSNPPS